MRRRVYISIVAGVLVIAACITIPCVVLISPVSSKSGGSSSGAGGDDGHGGKGRSSEDDGSSSSGSSNAESEINPSLLPFSGSGVGLGRTESEQEGRSPSSSAASSSFTSSAEEFPRIMSSLVDSSSQRADSQRVPTLAAGSSSGLSASSQAANSAAAVAQASVEPAKRVSGNAATSSGQTVPGNSVLRAAVSAIGSTQSVSSSRNQRAVAASAVVEPQLIAVAQNVAASIASAAAEDCAPSFQRSQPSIKAIIHNAASGKISNSRVNGLDELTAGLSDLARTVTDGNLESDVMNLMPRVGEHIDTSGRVDIDGVMSSVSATGLLRKEQLGKVRVMIAEGVQAAQNGSPPSAEFERTGNEFLQSFGEMFPSDSASHPLQSAVSAASPRPMIPVRRTSTRENDLMSGSSGRGLFTMRTPERSPTLVVERPPVRSSRFIEDQGLRNPLV